MKCEKCGDELSDSNYLKEHMAVKHGDGEAPKRPCKLCQKEFRTIQALSRHKAIVHDPKQYVDYVVRVKS